MRCCSVYSRMMLYLLVFCSRGNVSGRARDKELVSFFCDLSVSLSSSVRGEALVSAVIFSHVIFCLQEALALIRWGG